jgi:hypothetical protein
MYLGFSATSRCNPTHCPQQTAPLEMQDSFQSEELPPVKICGTITGSIEKGCYVITNVLTVEIQEATAQKIQHLMPIYAF